MKHIIRALKYFVYISVILTLILLALSLTHVIGGSVDEIFKNGTDSLWQIALILAVFSALYPSMGFGKRSVVIPGDPAEIRPALLEVLSAQGYLLEKEDEDGTLCFRRVSTFQRLTRMFEDRLTFTRELTGYQIEGLVRDQVRVTSALEYRFRGE